MALDFAKVLADHTSLAETRAGIEDPAFIRLMALFPHTFARCEVVGSLDDVCVCVFVSRPTEN